MHCKQKQNGLDRFQGTIKIKDMYQIYYYNDGVYHYQKSYATLSKAKAAYNENYKGYIKKNERICKRYK